MRRGWRLSCWSGLDGRGGLVASGRWHRIGHPVVYASEHPALALVEVLANLRLKPGDVPLGLKLIAIDIADGATTSRPPDLPDGWQANEPATQAFGTRWLESRAGLLLPVPSAVLAHSTNFLLNPLHPQAKTHLAERSVESFWFDARLLSRAASRR